MWKSLLLKDNMHTKLIGTGKYLILLLTFTFSLVSQAIVIRHDTPDKIYRDLARNHSASVAYLDKCVATVLSKYWLITASQCVSISNQYPLAVKHLVVKYPVEEIIIPPSLSNQGDLDIALIKLKWPLKNAKPVAIYHQSDELGKQVIFVGKGLTGTGLTGDSIKDSIERAATNTVNKVDLNWLSFSFNKPPVASELEGISGAGDSGGPAFIFSEQGIKLAGVRCCQVPVMKDNNEEYNGAYLSTEYYSRLSPHRAWIEQQVARVPHKKTSESLILQALTYDMVDTAKQLLREDRQWLKNSAIVTDILVYSLFRSNDLSYFLLNNFPELHNHKIKAMPLSEYVYLQNNEVVLSLLIKLGVARDYSGFKGRRIPISFLDNRS